MLVTWPIKLKPRRPWPIKGRAQGINLKNNIKFVQWLTINASLEILFVHHLWLQEISQINCSIFCSLFANFDSIWATFNFLSIFPTAVDSSISDETIGRINERSLDHINKTVQIKIVPVWTWSSWISWPLHFESFTLTNLVCFKYFGGFLSALLFAIAYWASTQMRIQADTLKTLCDWLSLSNSIFDWLRVPSS